MEKIFRSTKEKRCELVEVLRPYISPRVLSPNFRELDADEKLAVCLYYLKDTDSIWMTANTFDFTNQQFLRSYLRFVLLLQNISVQSIFIFLKL